MPDIGRLGYWSTIQKIYHDQYRCSGMTFSVLRVEGALTPEIVRKALYRLQRRHPLLRACFVEEDRYYRFQVAPDNNGQFDEDMQNVPLRVLNRRDGSHWQEILEHEFSRDLDPDSGVLWRTIFLHSESHCCRSELINLIHHSVSDGSSQARFAHDLLFLCSQISEGTNDAPDRPTLPLLAAAERMVPQISPSPKPEGRVRRDHSPERPQTRWDFEAHAPLNERRPRGLYFQIHENDMTVLKARCRQEHTTVSSALVAALLLSASKETGSAHPIPFSFAIDLRGYCEPKVTSEHFGCYVMMEQAVLNLSERISFWDLARNCGQELTNRVGLKRNQGFMPREFHKTVLRLIVEGNLVESDSRQEFAGGPCLSNMGVLDLPKEYGPFRLKEIYFGSPHPSGLYSVFLCVATLHGRLFCALSYTEPLLSRRTAESIADSFVSRLATACKPD